MEEMQAAMNAVMKKGWYILGDAVSDFEANFAAYTGSKHCIGVANGLDAMVLSLKALDLPPESEVIVPSNTYIATILAVVLAGLTPVLAEPDPETLNIHPEEIKKLISPKTKAIMVVHLYGNPCDMDSIKKLAEVSNLFLLEDCAQSHGARYHGSHTGTFGIAGCFSFYPTKNLGALGDAGAIITSDDSLATKLRILRNYGSDKKYHNTTIGYNSRLDELQAAVLNVKLKYLNAIVHHKRIIAELYNTGLYPHFQKIKSYAGAENSYHIYPVATPRRDELRAFLSKNDIGTEIHYPVPPHHQEGYPMLSGKSYPVSEYIHRHILSLPCSTALSVEEAMNVVEKMNEFVLV